MRNLYAVLLIILSLRAMGQDLPIDKDATMETKRLYQNLKGIAFKGVLYGHQNDLAHGVGWDNQFDRSNVKELSGSLPFVFGWDLGWLEVGKKRNIESIPFDNISKYIKFVYAQGGVNTISWHFNNPVAPTEIVRTTKLVDSTVSRLFSNPSNLNRYKSWLDTLAKFVTNLKGPNGEPIPLIFRPFHENTGNWFWWGNGQCTPEQYAKLWQFTVNYLIRVKHVHNLLYAYSTDAFDTQDQYLNRYPGDKYVDVLGFDFYDGPKIDNASMNLFTPKALNMVKIVRQLGQQKQKIWAFTETGYKNMPIKNWWTNNLYPVLKNSGLSYVLIWGYYKPDDYFDTFKGQVSADDFLDFSKNHNILFLNDKPKNWIYK